MPGPRRWLVLAATVAPELHDEAAGALLSLGGTAVQIEGDTLTSYVPRPLDPEAFVAGAVAALPGGARVAWRLEDDQDWTREWRKGLRPRRTGPFVVSPTWCEPRVEPGEHLILIDPEMAFGTGEHATTRGALRLLSESVRPGDRVLDVGTGSAILAIAAAMIGAGHVLAVEADPDALENAADNLRRNGVAGRVELVHALVDAAYLAARGTGAFDVVVANVLSGVLRPLLPSFRAALVPEGRLILGGILEEEADEMTAVAAAAGFALRVEDLEAEWWGALFAAGPVS